jgi:hypothetical protein
VVHEQGVTVTRFSRITALALAIAAVAAPAAPAQDLVTPDARDAGRPVVIDRVSPDARDNGRREAPPVVVSAPPVAQADGFDWRDAGIGGAAIAVTALVAFGATTTVRTRHRGARTA